MPPFNGASGTPGAEVAYIARATAFNTTNTTAFNAAAIITSLSVTVTGKGRPVRLEFYCPAMGHSAGAAVTSYFIINGISSSLVSPNYNWSTTQTSGGSMVARFVLTGGVDYTFGVGLQGVSAGTTTAFTNGAPSPMWLSVVQL